MKNKEVLALLALPGLLELLGLLASCRFRLSSLSSLSLVVALLSSFSICGSE
jgi:hypothetical protein